MTRFNQGWKENQSEPDEKVFETEPLTDDEREADEEFAERADRDTERAKEL